MRETKHLGKHANKLAEEAKEILVPLSKKAYNLRLLADYVVTRNN